MIGIVGKLKINYKVNDTEFEEVFEIDEKKEYFLRDCDTVKFVIDEVYYVVDTIYGISVLLEDEEDETILVSGNEETEFVIEKDSVYGTMKIVMF